MTPKAICPACNRRICALENTPALDPSKKQYGEYCRACYEERGYRLLEVSDGVSRWFPPRVHDDLPEELLFDPRYDLNGIRYSRTRWSR